MKDQLEDFINKNRQAFDDKEPSEKVWNNIEATLPAVAGANRWNSVVMWRAAAIVFMVLSIYLLIPKMHPEKQRGGEMALKEFRDVEAFYVAQISEKVELIDEYQTSEGLNGFTQDFKQLEAMYMVLKEEMKTHPSQKVKDALVLNLLVRIDLLNQQLHHLEKAYKSESQTEDSDKRTDRSI